MKTCVHIQQRHTNYYQLLLRLTPCLSYSNSLTHFSHLFFHSPICCHLLFTHSPHETIFLLFHDSSLLIMSLIYYFGHSHFPLIYSSIRSHSLITHSPFHSFIIALSDLLSFCQNSTLTHSLHSLCDLSLSILLLYHSHTLIIRIFTLSSRTLILSICFYFYSSIPLSLALSLSKTLTIYNE